MDKILFSELVQRYFPSLEGYIEEVNGKRNRPTYLVHTMMNQRFSVNQTWESSALKSSIVAADVVTMDSNLPLKSRDRISYAHGELPKIGMKMQLKESEINELHQMAARGTMQSEIVTKIMDDAARCVNGVEERLEFLFLQGISNGMCVIADDLKTGVGIRVNYGYLAENKFGASRTWGDAANATPITDLNNVIAAAADKGDTITTVMMAKEAFDALRQTKEAKELCANMQGIPVLSTSVIPTPTETTLRSALRDELGIDVIVVNRSVRVEKNGTTTSVRPFNRDKVILLTDTMVGDLVYGQLVEEVNPSSAAIYTKGNAYTLVKKWHVEEPFAEITSAQAIALPVLNNVESIYQLDINEAVLVDDPTEVEGDANINLFDGQSYAKASVVAALNELGVRTSANISDARLKEKVNALSEDKVEELKSILNA
ncbi:MAG: major capsid protein [Paludibacteraceae bacterium]|nr:major capsid protein [Paludibacteraceae bacterium]